MVDNFIVRIGQLWIKPVLTLLLLAGGAWFAPVTIPVLPIDGFISYMRLLPIKPPPSEHSHEGAILPQHYADQFGWDEIVDEVAIAWNKIPAAERNDCGIFAQDYGQAGAIDFLGKKYGLPAALSGHQSWWLWGPRGYTGKCVIVLDDNRETLEKLFERVDLVGSSRHNSYALERDIPVYICRGPKFGTLADLWPRVKKWR